LNAQRKAADIEALNKAAIAAQNGLIVARVDVSEQAASSGVLSQNAVVKRRRLAVRTCVLAEYALLAACSLTSTRATINPFCRNGGFIERLDVGGLPLGIQAGAKYESASVVLAPGDWLVIFTDGLVEAVNAAR